MWNRWIALLLLVAFLAIQGSANECEPRTFGPDRIVCVCNATYCDSTPENNPRVPQNGTFYWYTSSKAGLRMSRTKGRMDTCHGCNVLLNIDTEQRYQEILGFGGAFTDSSGINMKTLSPQTQDQLLRTYFDRDGSRYMMARVPIGGSDFSTRPYTYDDTPNDRTLNNFTLAPEDYEYKIPFIKRALEINPNLTVFSAAWSPPPWMKTNDKINGFGFLKTEYYQLYADYILRFLDEYERNGINIWAVSTGNEPINAYVPLDPLNTMGWTPRTAGKWVANNLGPTLASSRHNQTKILALDDQRIEIPWFVKDMFKVPGAKDYTFGTALHWYTDTFVPATVVTQLHNDFPDKMILMTEACTGSNILDFPKVILGSWERGVEYVKSIITYMNHYTSGWVDWNIALNRQGGPNWIKNYVDSPIIVNPENDEFFKNPMYYALKHFSRFVSRGSVKVSINNAQDIQATAFVTPEKEVVVVIYNGNSQPTSVALNDARRGQICLELPEDSINTIIYAE